MSNFSSIASDWAKRFTSLLGDPEEDEVSANPPEMLHLLTPDEMNDADRRAVNAGIRSALLMERAGRAVADTAGELAPLGSRIAIMAGPGNNGGDGFVAARLLAEQGYLVTVFLVGDRDNLKGDARGAAEAWNGRVESPRRNFADGAQLIIDALFGAGLDRPIEGPAADMIDGANESGVPILAVDLPSGVDGESGAILGSAVIATQTVTFFRRKPGHLLLPGRILCGSQKLVDIGHDRSILDAIRPRHLHNNPRLWLDTYPRARIDGHKYDRGHTVVVSGPLTGTGAARLAARGALRVGSGLVTVASPPDAVAANAAHLTAIMLTRMYEADGLEEILSDQRHNAVVLGPALGVGDAAANLVLAALASEAAVVIDADGLTSFADAPDDLFEAIREREGGAVVLTPHDGEFGRLFPDLIDTPSKVAGARLAAERSGAFVVLKGPDTVVAGPDGIVAIADNAPPVLATAGAGDVLAGLVGGLLAQRMPGFDAAAAAVWLHGAAAARVGPGLISEDLPEVLPGVLGEILR